MLAAADSAYISAQSSPFAVRPPADLCGICGGDSTSCAGCDFVPNSGKRVDLCGICGGRNACVGCDAIAFSGQVKSLKSQLYSYFTWSIQQRADFPEILVASDAMPFRFPDRSNFSKVSCIVIWCSSSSSGPISEKFSFVYVGVWRTTMLLLQVYDDCSVCSGEKRDISRERGYLLWYLECIQMCDVPRCLCCRCMMNVVCVAATTSHVAVVTIYYILPLNSEPAQVEFLKSQLADKFTTSNSSR